MTQRHVATPVRGAQPPATETVHESPTPPPMLQDRQEEIMSPASTVQDAASLPSLTSPAPSLTSTGTMQVQPVVPPALTKAVQVPVANTSANSGLEEVDPEALEIPELGDPLAPTSKLGVHDLNSDAVRQRAKRIFTPRADGSLKVSQAIFDEWKSKGKERKNLEMIFKQCGYDPDTSL